MARSISLEVESNDNCDGLSMQVFEVKEEPAPVLQVRFYPPREAGGGPETLCDVTGWQSDDGGSPCPAYFAPVSDSGEGVAYLVFGGDWGLRLRPAGANEPWDIGSRRQWGEAYILLSDMADIISTEN